MTPATGCAAALAIIATAGAAQAQDWSGAYYGGSLGFGSGSYTQGVEVLDVIAAEVDVSGLIYGLHAGVNLQSGPMVFGIDAGLSSGVSGSVEIGTVSPGAVCRTGECFVDINAIGTLRGRIGYVTDIRTVVYGAAGLAIASVEGGIRNSAQEGSSTASGMTYAIGAERITSPFSTIFAAIGYYDLGTLTFGTNEELTSDEISIEDFTASGDFITITAGINYKF